jgi:hypothetical protein
LSLPALPRNGEFDPPTSQLSLNLSLGLACVFNLDLVSERAEFGHNNIGKALALSQSAGTASLLVRASAR